ncbi:hypothetical protein HZS55_19330 [Halosimplex rubrum]|uniref:Uncharacterized protein n=1 Tax=Halosimplex rubrum TaxID=869889 RepID=A0A7D5T7V2_9EURY|nr:hypothetical protein [Halosimplex rubrum]QLH79313.1 hypothetical protein HZS55_19330 [Halosimplex rubrum]
MSADHPRAGVVSARGALAVAACVATAVFAFSGAGAVGLLGVAGTLVFGWGVGALDPSRTRRLAAGSVSVAVGTAALAAAAGWLATTAGRAGHAVVLAGAAAVALAALAGVSDETTDRLTRAVSESGFVALVALAAAVAWFLLVGTGFVPGLVAWAFAGATASPVVAAVWLQVAALAAGLAAERAGRALDALVPGRGAPDSGLAASFRLTLDEVPRWYLATLVVALLFGSAAVVRDAVGSALAARPLVGRVVDAVVLTGVAHAALGVVIALSLCVAVAPAVHRAIVFWTGPSPGNTVAYGAGGLVAVAVALGGGALATVARAFDLSTVVAIPTPVAVAVPALVAALCGLLAVLAFVHALYRVTELFVGRAEGFAVGAALALVGTALLADALPTLVVVTAAAGALAVWDLGVHAVGFERDLGGVRPPTRTELVHATATGTVLAGAVAVALLVGYFAVPIRVPDDRATVALALVMVSVVAFAVALRE